MNPQTRRRHLHASVGAAALYGMAVGAWMAARSSEAGWLEWAAFSVLLILGPLVVMSKIDTAYGYEDQAG